MPCPMVVKLKYFSHLMIYKYCRWPRVALYKAQSTAAAERSKGTIFNCKYLLRYSTTVSPHKKSSCQNNVVSTLFKGSPYMATYSGHILVVIIHN